MRRSHSRGQRARRQSAPASAPAAAKEGPAMEQLHKAMEHTDFLDSRKKTYVPKPKAIRRYEKFASMGDEK